MRTWLRTLATASLVIAWPMTGGVAHALAADVGGAGVGDGLKYAIALATVGILALLLLALRFRRRAAGDTNVDIATADALTPSPDDDRSEEARLPRWRRPSVVAARFGLARPGSDHVDPRAFDEETTDPDAERMVVRYDAVPLVDEPDDVLGRLVDELGIGDEVEIVERDALWVRVRTPAKRSGWVPAMALARHDELPETWAEDVPTPADEPDGSDGPALEDLLAAIAAQRRAEVSTAAEPAQAKRTRSGRTTTRRKAAGAGS
jgi:hypothetical protein